MSATSVIIKNRGNLYLSAISELFSTGNDDILFNDFLLGTKVSESKKTLIYLNTEMLCSGNCEVSIYFQNNLHCIAEEEKDTNSSCLGFEKPLHSTVIEEYKECC